MVFPTGPGALGPLPLLPGPLPLPLGATDMLLPLLAPCPPCEAAMAPELTPSAAAADSAMSVLRNIAFLLVVARQQKTRLHFRRLITPKGAQKCRARASNI